MDKETKWSARVQSGETPVESSTEFDPFGDAAKDMFESLFGKNEELDAEIAMLAEELDDSVQHVMDEMLKTEEA